MFKIFLFVFFILISNVYSVVYNPKITVVLPDKNIPLKQGRMVKDYNLTNMWSDKWIDTSSLNSIIKDIFEPGMTDEEKAIAVWNFSRIYVYHSIFPNTNGVNEFLDENTNNQDNVEWPLKTINVYGFSICGINAFVPIGLWNAAGFKARRIGFDNTYPHMTSELYYDNNWHYMDVDIVFYVYTRDNKIASIEDIVKDPTLMIDPNIKNSPSYLCRGNDINDAPYKIPYVKPSFCSETETYTKCKNYDELKIDLYKGMQYKFYWNTPEKERVFYYPKSTEKEFKEKNRQYCMSSDRAEMPEWVNIQFGDRRWETGKLIYQPNLQTGEFFDNAEIKNLNYKPYIYPKKLKKEGEVVFNISLPYIISQATLEATFIKNTENDINEIWTSVNNKTWIKIWTNSVLGENKSSIDLGSAYKDGSVFGRYKYWVKLIFKADKNVKNVGLKYLKITTFFNFNKICLPRLSYGKNKLTFTADKETKDKIEVIYNFTEKGKGARQKMQEVKEIISSNSHQYDIEVMGTKEPKMYSLEINVQ